MPGPVIRMRLGEELRVAFTNRLPQPTTIHWHGVRVPNAMDGVPGVTQPPIEPGESFTYQFVPKDAGTFWFHPHVRTSEQIERGLYGVLVVEDAEPPPWSRDVVWVLDDWLLARDGQISAQFTTRHDLAHDGRWGNVITVNGSIHEELVVRPGERIRLRLLNSANGRMFTPDFGDLDVRVIAVDGMYTERPLDAQGFELAPGNRLDLDITIGAEQRGRRLEIIDRFTRRPFSLATIVVRDEPPVATPSFPSLARGRIPAWSAALEAPLTKEYRLNARAGGRFGIEWTIDGQAYPEHTIQSLPEGRWAKVRFVNESYRLHPMHIHGQFFKLLTRDGEPADEPFWRDTVLLHRKESVEIGLVPVDIGKWMLHCHILEHAEAGMMTVVDVE